MDDPRDRQPRRHPERRRPQLHRRCRGSCRDLCCPGAARDACRDDSRCHYPDPGDCPHRDDPGRRDDHPHRGGTAIAKGDPLLHQDGHPGDSGAAKDDCLRRDDSPKAVAKCCRDRPHRPTDDLHQTGAAMDWRADGHRRHLLRKDAKAFAKADSLHHQMGAKNHRHRKDGTGDRRPTDGFHPRGGKHHRPHQTDAKRSLHRPKAWSVHRRLHHRRVAKNFHRHRLLLGCLHRHHRGLPHHLHVHRHRGRKPSLHRRRPVARRPRPELKEVVSAWLSFLSRD